MSRSLRRARRERGLTQRALANRSGISEKYLSRIELGQVTPSALVAFRICDTLGSDLGQLVSMQPAVESGDIRKIVKLLRDRPDDTIDCARRILVELFR